MLIVTTREDYEITKNRCKQVFNINDNEFKKSTIILRYTKVNYQFMIIDENIYYAKGVDFELRYRILIYKILKYIRRANYDD